MNRLIINPEKSALINVPIPTARSKKKASVTKTMLISAREYIKSVRVNSETTSIVPSSGMGAIDDSKYKAVPGQVRKSPNQEKISDLNRVVGKTKSVNKNNHVSSPIPVIIEVIKAKYSGRLFSAIVLKINIETPTTISHVPTVKPNVRFNPTNK